MNSDSVPAMIKIESDREYPLESDQPTIEATQQKGKRTADQPDLMLNMNCSTRDQLITSLNQLSVILQSNKPITESAKERIRNRIDKAMQILVDLSPFEPVRSLNLSDPSDEMVFGEMIVELAKSERSKIINHLISVRDEMMFNGLTVYETKTSLFTENKRSINQLLELPIRDSRKEQSNESDEDGNESIAGLLLKQQRGR